MRIPCPFCGERDSSEFTYLGDAEGRPPKIDELSAPDAQGRCFESVYLRNNPAGPHQELWYHALGCRGWLQLNRDTRTHEIFGAAFVKEAGRP